MNTILKINFGLLLCAALSSPLFAATSDLLIVVDADGRNYLAQHTLTTDQELLVLKLPSGRRAMQTQFTGPEKLTFSTAHRLKPNVLTLWSGSVMTRYTHRYDKGVDIQDNGTVDIDFSRAHYSVDSEEPVNLSSSVTWVLPENLKLVSFNEDNKDAAIVGSWISDRNTIQYTQSQGALSSLSLRLSQIPDKPEVILDPCTAVIGPTDECSPDIDLDGVPDYRDVCLSETVSITETNQSIDDQLGCSNQSTIILDDIHFEVGKSYLNAASRTLLDRAAIALQRIPDQLFEVAAHTDNAGTEMNNQRLSENRAAAVRHYLMLRGVGPNQLTAVGYGELSPTFSNDTSAGRKSNRRVELRQLNY